MNNQNDKKHDVERFLTGEMGEKDALQFRKRCSNDSELKQELEQESGVDALLSDSGNVAMHDVRFSAVVDRVLGSNDSQSSKKGPLWLYVYAVAATLVLALLGGYGIRSLLPLPSKGASTIETGKAGEVVIPSTGRTVTRLAEKALFVSEQGTKAKVVKRNGNSIQVLIAQGNICFDVSETGDREIIVATPHTAIAVQGAVTRVVVTELETEISVLDGMAEVVHRYDSGTTRVMPAGSTCFADFQKLETTAILTREVCENKTNMFRDYVTWIQKQARG
jgi:ferric-dicitrate binding protein FerR (iron transport regulator)